MFNVLSIVKALFSDKKGVIDHTHKSTQLSTAAQCAIAAGCIAAAAGGANALSTSANNAGDTAAQKVNAPLQAQAAASPQSKGPVYQ